MKKRILVAVLVMSLLLFLAAAASADVTVCGYDTVEFQLGLPLDKPAEGGFFSRGAQFNYGIDGQESYEVYSTIHWSVDPIGSAPALTITADGPDRSSARAWLNLNPSVSYTAGESYQYLVSMDNNGVTASKTITANFVNNPLPSGYGLTVASIDLTASPAAMGTAADMTNGKMYMVSGETYAVTSVISGTNMGYYTNDRGWSSVEWSEIDLWDSRIQHLELDGGNAGVYTAKRMGIYDQTRTVTFYRNNTASNLGCYIPYTLYVTDGQGNLPSLKPELWANYAWADWDDDVIDYTIYSGLGIDSSETLWNNPELIRFYINNENLLNDQVGGAPVWTVNVTGDPLDIDYDGDSIGIHGTLNSMPAAASESTVTVTCTWGQESTTKTIQVHTADPASVAFPTGVSIPGVDENGVCSTQEGQTITMEPSIRPESWGGIPGCSPAYYCRNWLSGFANQDWSYQSSASAKYNVTTAGIYHDLIGLSYGALMVTQPVTFRVADQNGVVPVPTLTLRNSNDSINRYLGMTDAYREQYGVYSLNALAGAKIEDYDRLRAQLTGDPVWTVEQISGDPLPFTSAEGDDGQTMEVRLEAQDLTDANYQPGDAVIRITCTWDGLTDSVSTEVHLLNAPNGLPEGIDYNNGSDTVDCRVGDKLYVTPSILPSTWTLPGYQPEYTGNSGEFERFCDVDNDSSGGRELTVTTPGIYRCFVGVRTDTIIAGRQITYRVTDENGNMSSVTPDIHDNRNEAHEMNFYLGMRFTEGTFYTGEVQTEPQIDHFYLNNVGILAADYPNDQAVWTLTKLSGTAELKMDLDSSPDMDLRLRALPTGPENAKWKIECDWGPAHWETEYTIHFMISPTGLPTGLEMDFGNTLVVKTGEKLGLADKVRFKNGWYIPNEYMDTMIGGGMNWQEGVTHDDHWIWDVAAKPGIYDCNVSKMCGNIRWFEDFTLIVTEADGTLNGIQYFTSYETVAEDTLNGITYTLDTAGTLTVTGASDGAAGTGYTGIVGKLPSSFNSYRNSIIRIVIGPNTTGVGYSAFTGLSNLKSLEVGEGVTTLEQNAFAGNSNLQNVTLPSTLKELGEGVFASCSALTGIIMPEGLKQIGNGAFGGCSLLAAISLPEGLESIGNYAFGGCEALAELTIPSTVSSLGMGITSSSPLIKSITVPSALETVPENSFSNNPYLEEIVIPGGVKELSSGAFRYCSNLRTVTIGEGLETIGSAAFQGCDALKEITLPASLTTILDGAFSSSLETVTILSNNVAIAENAFDSHRAKIRCSHASAAAIYANTYSMELEYLDPAIVTVNGVTYELDPDGTLTITGDGENGAGTGGLGIVDTLPGWIYNERGNIVKIVFGENIESVTYAFGNATNNLAAVEIGDSVKTLGEGVFRNCSNLTAVTISEGLERIDANAFEGCTNLTAICLPASLKNISSGAFDTSLTSATIYSTDANIAEGAFTDQLEAIRCYQGSTADRYAEDNSITAIYFGTETVQDGIIYILDAEGTLTVTGDGENGTGTGGMGIIGTLPTGIQLFHNDIVKIVVGANIESVGDHTGHAGPFSNLPNLVSINIGEGVTDIGSLALYNDANLRNIQLPSTLKRIGYNAFMSCTSLIGLDLPEGLESIGSYAFCNCTSLEELVFPSTVTSMGYPMASGCSSLKKVTLPASMETITNNMMEGCSGLEEVIIPAGIKELGTQVFLDCINLHTVTIEEGLETIGNGVFQNCPNLKAIVLPASLLEIRGGAFDATLETATILSNNAEIIDRAFIGYQATLRCNYDSKAGEYARAHGMAREYLDITGDFVVRNGVLVEYMGSDTELVIPAECEGQTVTAIGETVFAGKAFTSVSIPGSVNTIGLSAFTNNTSLETVTIGEGTETIGDNAFIYCTGLTHVNLPSTLKSIGEHAFQYDSSLTSITLPNGLTELGYMAFSYCTSLQEITIPGSVTSIGELAFSECSGLQRVTVEEGVTNLGTRTFYMGNSINPALTSVSLPEGLLVIGDTCFACNTNLTGVTLPSTLTTIGEAAFLNTGLTEVTIPAGVADVPSAAFETSSLKKVTLAGTNTTIHISNISGADDIWCLKDSTTMAGLLAKQVYGPYRIHCIGLPDYAVNANGALTACNMHAPDHNVPQTADGIPVTTLAAGAFADDEWPETILLPEGLTTVESGAMSNLGHLGKVRFPASLSAIPANTISGCPNLNCVVIQNPDAVIDEDAFPGVTEMTIFCHPESTAEAFAQSKGFHIQYISGSFVTDGNGTLLEYIGNETEVTVPEGIVSIGRSAFKGAAGVQTVILPESLTSIGQYAFHGCSQLSLIVFSGAENEFAGIDIGYGAIDSNVTVYCQLLWREKITEEGDESDIRLTLKRDGILYAEGTGEIRSGMMPYRIPYGSGGNDSPVMRGAKNRSGGFIQGSGEEPEINTSALPLVIGEGITALRAGAIENCSYIYSVQIPASMTEIEPMGLYNNHLQEVTAVGENPAYTSAEGVLFTKDGETLVQYPARKQGGYAIPEGVKRIGNYAFYDAYVPTMTLPSTLTTIGEGAFNYARTDWQARFTVPDGLRTIEAGAFQGYDGPDYLVMPEGLETVGDNAFGGTSSCIIFTGSPRNFGTGEEMFTLYCYPDSTVKEWGYNNNCNVCMINANLFLDYGGTIEMPETITLRPGQETEVSVTLQPSFFSGIPVTLTIGDPNSPGTQIAELSQTDGKARVRALWEGISTINVAVGYDEASPDSGFTREIRLMVPFSITMLTGQGIYLTDGSDPNVSCSALPTGQDVLGIDGEYIEALKPGQVTVKAVYYGRIEIPYVITVVSGSEVKLPQGLTTIEEDAFNGDSSFRFVELPQNVQTVKAGAFANIGDINVNVLSTNIQFEEGVFSGSNPVFFIPSGTGLEAYLNANGYLYFYNE